MKLTRVLAGFASVALLVVGLVAFLPDSAYACSGGGAPVSAQEVAKRGLEAERGAVFSGEVQHITKFNDELSQTITFRTIDVWKGPHRDTLKVTQGNICPAEFEEGQEYLVYAYHDADQGLSVNLFTAKLLSDASEEVQALSRLVDTSGIVPGSVVLGLAGLTATAAFLLMRRLLKTH
jgi:hypothetical protein